MMVQTERNLEENGEGYVMMERQTIRIHRVGSVTFGVVLVVMGVMFLLHVFFPRMDYEMIFHFWPLILISLGVEVLFGSRQKAFEIRKEDGKLIEQGRVVYDVAAIILTMVLTLFAMIMGMIDWATAHSGYLYF